MYEIDPGHEYALSEITPSGNEQAAGMHRLLFVKREGADYPANVGSHNGVTTQEVLRALIKRMLYVDRQIPCVANKIVIGNLRESIIQLERRAAERHDMTLPSFEFFGPIEDIPTCPFCGHIVCKHKGHTHE